MGTTRPAREGGSAVLLRLCVCVASSGRARRRGGGVLRVHRQRVEEGADDGHGGPRGLFPRAGCGPCLKNRKCARVWLPPLFRAHTGGGAGTNKQKLEKW